MKRLFLLLFGMVTFVAHAQVPDYVPTDGLVAWYPFNGNANDESGNGHDGTMDGALFGQDRNDSASASATFDGVDDGIFIPHHADFESAEKTISFWMNPTSNQLLDTPGLYDGMGILNKTDHTASNTINRYYAVTLGQGTTGTAPFSLTLASSTGNIVTTGSNVESTTAQDAINVNDWQHVSAVQTATELKLYLNGIQISSSPLLNPPLENDYDIKIGVDYKFTEYRYFNGSIDDISFHNRSLTEEEVLTLYNTVLPVTGCTDSNACNYSSEANSDDGTCVSCETLADACGEGTIWDSNTSTCIVANPTDTDLDGCTGVGDVLEVLSTFGQCYTAADTTWACGDPMNYYSYEYATVQIGNQCWFAENLRNELYANGDEIQAGLSQIEWQVTTDGAVATYGEGESTCFGNCDEETNLELFGRLYNWYAVNDERSLCPSGWHVSTDEEFIAIEMQLGMSETDAYYTGWARGTDQGAQMKSSPSDTPSWNGTNALGLNGLSGGLRYGGGSFGDDSFGCWWTATDNSGSAWNRILSTSDSRSKRDFTAYNWGFSVRCVND